MALDAVLFDIDGTLIDSNPAHVEAWERAFASRGYKIARDRIEIEVGKGGDKLVPSILGQSADQRDGDALRKAEPIEFARIAKQRGLRPFPSAIDLLADLRRRNLTVILATSSNQEQLDALIESSGVDLKSACDVLATADDADESKPSPDIVVAAVRKAGLSPAQCAMVGDTLYDMEAAKHAGVIGLGVLTGYQDRQTLAQAGARGVWRDVAEIREKLDEVLRLASPTTLHLRNDVLERLMLEALAAAQQGLAAGEVPIGCVLANGR